jgi:ankyrin repeat protein
MLVSMGHDPFTKDSLDRTVLHEAAESGSYNLVRFILRKYPSLVHEKTKHGWTALHIASERDSAQIVGELLKLGIDIDAVNEYGRTALHLAAANGSKEIVGILKEHHANLSVMDKSHQTALDLAGLAGDNDRPEMLVEV